MTTNVSTLLSYTEIHIPRRQKDLPQEREIADSTISKVPCWTLIDTGALHGNYAGRWISELGLPVKKISNRQICSPVNNQCIPCADSIIVIACIYDEHKITKFEIELEFKILSSLDNKEYGLIIGLPDIKKHNLMIKFADQFSSEHIKLANPHEETTIGHEKKELKSVSIEKSCISCSLLHKSANLSIDLGVGSVDGGLKSSTSVSTHTSTAISSAQAIPEVDRYKDSLSSASESNSRRTFHHRIQKYDEDEEVIQGEYWDDAWMKDGVDTEEEDFVELIASKITSSDPTFVIEAKAFLKPYKDLFSRNLNPIPADLPPLEIEVDSVKFNVGANNQGAPRLMTAEKEHHIKKFIEEGLISKVIRPSNSAYYSQVHLVPKPSNEPVVNDNVHLCPPRKWRTTIDYRRFNKCITTQHWPLPNISSMIQRIGKKKPKYFAKLDMTSGYWQAPLAENTKRFTAFITFMGIFEWNRAPMGTQPAGGYFHQCIAFIVLAGLVYSILESYIDDILVFAETREKFWENLTLVFQQFVSKSLTGPQLRWSTPEKEMYAFYYTVKKLEYILGDVRFTWWTDHKNNTLTRDTGSDKVLRWDLYLQGFDYDRLYIKGENNFVTDDFSRLCIVSDKTEYLTLLEEWGDDPLAEEYVNLISESIMTNEDIALLVQPRILSYDIFKKLSTVHNSIVGHLGVERTLVKLKRSKDIWEGMRSDVILFIQQCPCCQKMSRIKIPIHTAPFTTASYGLMKKLSCDCIGPLKATPEGYTHILVIIDNFSRYAMLYAILGVTALEIAKCLIMHIGIFGCPQIIQMDNGTEFINEMVSEVIKITGTRAGSILAYSKEENAIVERCNKEVMRHIRAMVFEINKRDAWSIYVPLAQRIINSEVHSRIGVSPNELVFGGKVDLDGGFLDTPITASKDVKIASWSSDMIQLQHKLIDIAQKRQTEQDEKFMQKRQGSIITQFDENSFVLVLYPGSAMGQRAPTKLHMHWKGPMRVISNQGAEYVLHDLVQDKQIPIHVSRLKKFEHDPRHVDPLAIAAKDYEEDEVERILDHKGDPKRKSSLDFLVRWLGYDETEDLWLPWSSLRTNAVLHQYLRDNNMGKLIPK